MPTEETAYKGRVNKLMMNVADRLKLRFWSTALGKGAISGVPDKWFNFGSVCVFHELKRKGHGPRKLQEHRINQLQKLGFIAFCTSANPDSLGVKGEERQEIYRAMLEQLSLKEVEKRVMQYTVDARKLREHLEELMR